MTLSLDPDGAALSLVDIDRVAADLREQRARAVRDVTSLLDGGWSGRAASAFASGWADWLGAADEVLDALDALAEQVRLAHTDLLSCDDRVGRDVSALASRLG